MKLQERIANLDSLSKIKLIVIFFLFIAVLALGGYNIYKDSQKVETKIQSKSELIEFLSDTLWIREDKDGNDEMLLFTQFFDFYSATITKEGEILYTMPSSYLINDFSHFEIVDSRPDEFMSRMNGKHEIIVTDKNFIEVDGKIYEKSNKISEIWQKLYYVQVE